MIAGEICMGHKSVYLPAGMVKKIEELISKSPELGYASVRSFVEDAVRRRLEQIEKRRTVHA